MADVNLTTTIRQFLQRGTDYLQDRHNDAVLQIKNNLALLRQSISCRDDALAVSDWADIDKDKASSNLVAPAEIRIGCLQLLNSDGAPSKNVDIPLLLPTKVNAVMMNLGTDSEKVPGLFQNIMLRILLSMRMDLVKVSVVDMDFGASFPTVSAIANPMFGNSTVYTQEEVTKLIEGLAREIGDANRNYLGRFPDIEAFNASAGEMAQPYHFVFIDDFPNGFTPQSIDNLLRIVDNGNATKAGIKIFINYGQKNPAPRDFDINRFGTCCSWINKDISGNISFRNLGFKCPSQVKTVLETDVTSRASEYIDYINAIKPRKVTYSLDGWIEDLKKNNQVWSGSTVDGIKVPIGYITPTKTFDFYMANDNDGSCNDFFALIAGQSGYGKTVLLHNIIVNAAMKYSPDELCLYLADFAEGASFFMYKDLPHVKALMLSNNKEYALRMLEDLEREFKIRTDLYKRAQKKYGKQITTLSSYRDITGEKLPRILFVMDEFHFLFMSTDMTTIRAKETLCNGIRQWRKVGISIILSTQSINGVNFGDADNRITYRFALNLLEMDSKTVIRNKAAMKLIRKGQTIMNNTSDGNEDKNVEFQSAFTEHYLDHVKYLEQLYQSQMHKKHEPLICEEGTDADICDNKKLLSSIVGNNAERNAQYCDAFVGRPDLLREEHTRIRYRRQQNSNTLIIGNDFRTVVYNVMVQMTQLKLQSPEESKFYLVDSFNVGDPYQNALKEMNTVSDCFITGESRDIDKYMDDIYAEFERRKEEQKNGGMTQSRIVLSVLNAQNCYGLKPQPGRFGTEPSETAKKLIDVLTDGAPLGIHCIIHTLSYETLFKVNNILDSNKHLSLFENLIMTKGADVDSMYLGGLKITAPEEDGRMIVINAKIDGEVYEQCGAYSAVTAEKPNEIVKYMSNLFEKYQYV